MKYKPYFTDHKNCEVAKSQEKSMSINCQYFSQMKTTAHCLPFYCACMRRCIRYVNTESCFPAFVTIGQCQKDTRTYVGMHLSDFISSYRENEAEHFKTANRQ